MLNWSAAAAGIKTRVGRGQASVSLEPKRLIGQIYVGKMSIDRQFDPDFFDFSLGRCLPFELRDRLGDQLRVEIETNGGDVTGLHLAQN